MLAAMEKHQRVAEEKKVEARKRQEKEEEKRRLKEEEEEKKKKEKPFIEMLDDDEAEEEKKKLGEKKDVVEVEEKEKKEKKKDGDGDDSDDDSAPPLVGNGGRTDKYVWVQTLDTVTVDVPVMDGLKSRDVECDIRPDKVKLTVKGKTVLEGDWHARVKSDDCWWSIQDGRVVQMTVEKFDKMTWWSTVIKGDAQINTKKIQPENSKLSDLDGETRSTVEKMMFDQAQKAQGKPTSDQQKQWEMLDKFKKAHPEMDFSKAQINMGGGGSMDFPTPS